MPEIRLDVRLLRPGALVAGVAAGRCVLVRAVPEPGAGLAWAAALAGGLPVPEVREARCGERHVLVAADVAGEPLSPAAGQPARAQAAALAVALVGHGVAVARLRPDDLRVCDGVLTVRAPVAGAPAGDDGEEAAFVAMVETACLPEPTTEVPRRRRAVPAAVVIVSVLAGVVTAVPWPGATGAPAPRAAAAVPPPAVVAPVAEPVVEPQPPAARVRRPAAKKKAKVKVKAKKRSAVAPAGGDAPARSRPARPPRQRPAEEPGDAVPVAGGSAEPLPAL